MTALPLQVTISPAPAQSRAARLAVLAAVFLAFVDNFAMLPVIGPRAAELGADVLGVGAAVAAYSATNLLFNLFGGALADRFGRRTVLVSSLVVSPLPVAFYAFAESLPAFLALRVVHGAVGGLIASAVFAVLADLAPVGSRGRSLGRAGALIGATAVLAPAVAGILRQRYGTETVFLAVAVVMAVGVLLVVRFLPETLSDPQRGRPGIRARTWGRLLAEPRLRLAYVGIGLLMATVGTVTAFVPVQLEARGEAASLSGMLFSVFGLVAVVVMLSRTSGIVDRRGPLLPAEAGLASLALALVLLAAAGTAAAAVAMVLLGLGYGLVFPGTAGSVALATDPAERGRAYGLFNVSFDLGVTVGPLLGGVAAMGGLAGGTVAGVGTAGAAVAFLPALALVLVGLPVIAALGRRARGASAPEG